MKKNAAAPACGAALAVLVCEVVLVGEAGREKMAALGAGREETAVSMARWDLAGRKGLAAAASRCMDGRAGRRGRCRGGRFRRAAATVAIGSYQT